MHVVILVVRSGPGPIRRLLQTAGDDDVSATDCSRLCRVRDSGCHRHPESTPPRPAPTRRSRAGPAGRVRTSSPWASGFPENGLDLGVKSLRYLELPRTPAPRLPSRLPPFRLSPHHCHCSTLQLVGGDPVTCPLRVYSP